MSWGNTSLIYQYVKNHCHFHFVFFHCFLLGILQTHVRSCWSINRTLWICKCPVFLKQGKCHEENPNVLFLSIYERSTFLEPSWILAAVLWLREWKVESRDFGWVPFASHWKELHHLDLLIIKVDHVFWYQWWICHSCCEYHNLVHMMCRWVHNSLDYSCPQTNTGTLFYHGFFELGNSLV